MRTMEVELNDPPVFEIGEKVLLKKMIRNDGTFPGKDVGEVLAKKGETGYIINIGTFLQTSYIYSVHFMSTNRVVGCLKRELESLDRMESAEESTQEAI